MMATAHVSMTGTEATPADVGAKHIRWGIGLFIFGLAIGYVPLAHYMQGARAYAQTLTERLDRRLRQLAEERDI
jgi:hypothetical protein